MKPDFDCIVVGAGPSGCAAAYELAEAGFRVCLLDRKAFPRPKPCAGALTIKTLHRLRYSVAPVIKWVAKDLEVSVGLERARTFHSSHPIAAMTIRHELDAFCLYKTQERGADFRIVQSIDAIKQDNEGVYITFAGGIELKCKYLIGADGANSRVARLGGFSSPERALALEGTVNMSSAFTDRQMRFDFNCVKNGYGWVFPKGDHLNVGLYTNDPTQTINKADVINYVNNVLGVSSVEHLIGYPLGIGGEHLRPAAGRVLLAGDAAGLSERLLGEGIHNAIKSGQIAGRAVISALKYGTDVSRLYLQTIKEVQEDVAACSNTAAWFYGSTSLGFSALSLQPARNSLMRGFAAGKTFSEILKTAIFSPLYNIRAVKSIREFEAEDRRSQTVPAR
jgi:geranylgeranyl reductase family protein